MIPRFLLVGLCLLASGGPALANGRKPATSTITFRKGMESHVAAGMTFGLLVSKDSGATWQWMCEDAIGYSGNWDPDYVYTTSGALFGTTFGGIKVMRDGCTFEETEVGMKFASTATLGSDNALYFASVDPADAKVYKSTDDGRTFPISADAGKLNDWYSSLEVAPSDPTRLYLSGHRFVPNPDGDAGNLKVFSMFTSTNAGVSWTELPVTDFTTKPNSTIDIVGISKTNPLVVFARVSLDDNNFTDSLYRSTDGGQSWTKILSKASAISFVLRNNGDLVAATQTAGTSMSTAASNGTTWTEVVGAPHINCLSENSAGELWACTQNYGVPTIPGDGFGIMKTTNLATWTGVLRFEEMQGPVSCAPGTVQRDQCDEPVNPSAGWCGMCCQLGCDPARCERICTVGAEEPAKPREKGCCQTGSEGARGLLALAAVVGMVLFRRRRRN